MEWLRAVLEGCCWLTGSTVSGISRPFPSPRLPPTWPGLRHSSRTAPLACLAYLGFLVQCLYLAGPSASHLSGKRTCAPFQRRPCLFSEAFQSPSDPFLLVEHPWEPVAPLAPCSREAERFFLLPPLSLSLGASRVRHRYSNCAVTNPPGDCRARASTRPPGALVRMRVLFEPLWGGPWGLHS